MHKQVSNSGLQRYESRINRVIELIKSDPAGDLGLERLAHEAGFSKYHFHRIFQSATGLTLAAAVTQIRLDQARQLMAQRPDLSLTDVALRCGFGSSSNFSRTFRKRFGVPPSRFDQISYGTANQSSQPSWFRDRADVSDDADWPVNVVTVEARIIGYLRVSRPYEDGRVAAAMKEMSVLVQQGLEPVRWLGFTWDHPDFVTADSCDFNFGVELANIKVWPQSLSRMELPQMQVAAITLAAADLGELIEHEVRALDWLYQAWLPRSGYEPTNHPTFESWDVDPTTSLDTHDQPVTMDVHLPVQRLG